MFACRFIFEVYAKKHKREGNWVLLPMFCWMLMDMYLREFDTYQGAIAPSYFKSHTNSWCSFFSRKKVFLMFGLKFTLFEVTSLLPGNLSALKKKLLSVLYRSKYTVRASITPNNCFVNYFAFNMEKQPLEQVHKISCT